MPADPASRTFHAGIFHAGTFHAGTFHAGQIALADWRGALPKEPNKRRPAVVVEDDGLFAPGYPNTILVPLTDDPAIRRQIALAVGIEA